MTNKLEKVIEKYIEARGARKTAVARVRLVGEAGFVVNGKDYKDYFKLSKHRLAVESPLSLVGLEKKMGVSVKVVGGGLTGQAEAVRHGLAGVLVKHNEEFRKTMRSSGFLTRDPRVVERKKYGLKKARRAPQWAKR